MERPRNSGEFSQVGFLILLVIHSISPPYTASKYSGDEAPGFMEFQTLCSRGFFLNPELSSVCLPQ